MKVADLSSKEEIAIFEKAKNQVEEAGIPLSNSLEVVELQMAEPTLDDTMPDVERLTRALRKFMNLKRIRVPYSVLRKLPDVLRASKFSVKCVVRATPDDMFVCNTCRYNFFAESVHQSTAQSAYHASRECHEASKSCQVSDNTRTKCHTDTPCRS